MNKVGEYSTVHDFWTDLNDALMDKDTKPVRGRHWQRKIEVSSEIGDLSVRAIYRDGYFDLTSLRVSHRIDMNHSHSITKMDFERKHIDELDAYRQIGHLSISGYPDRRPSGLYVVETSTIPAPQQQELDAGVRLLLDK